MSLKTGHRVADGWLALAIAASGGCGLVPRHFPELRNPDSVVRAAEIGAGPRQSTEQAAPGLVNGLQDGDPVVRLVAFEELRGRTGRTFGYVPWGGPTERAAAVRRWEDWLAGRASSSGTPSRSASSSTSTSTSTPASSSTASSPLSGPLQTGAARRKSTRKERARDRRLARRERRRRQRNSSDLAQTQAIQ